MPNTTIVSLSLSLLILFLLLCTVDRGQSLSGHLDQWINDDLYYNSATAGRISCSIFLGDVSNCSYRLTVHPLMSSRLSSA